MWIPNLYVYRFKNYTRNYAAKMKKQYKPLLGDVC